MGILNEKKKRIGRLEKEGKIRRDEEKKND